LPQGYIQNTPDMPRYRKAVEAGRLPVYRGIALTMEDRLRRAAIERLMCNMAVDLGALCKEFKLAPDHFAPELDILRRMSCDGLVETEGEIVSIPERSRHFMRNVAAVFDTYLNQGVARHSQAV
jgi:oxygen-independent coproporphyrinogen-3 oxidase